MSIWPGRPWLVDAVGTVKAWIFQIPWFGRLELINGRMTGHAWACQCQAGLNWSIPVRRTAHIGMVLSMPYCRSSRSGVGWSMASMVRKDSDSFNPGLRTCQLVYACKYYIYTIFLGFLELYKPKYGNAIGTPHVYSIIKLYSYSSKNLLDFF